MPLTLSLLFFFTLKGMPLRAQLVFFSNCQFCHFCNNWLFCCPWSQLHFAHTNNFFGINNTKKSVAKCLKKKLNKKVYFLLNFFEKGCQQQQQLNTHFFFQKETTESWFQQQMRKFFFLFVSSFAWKKGSKRQIVLAFFFERKHCEVWSKNKGNKKETRRISKSLLLLLSKNCFASRKATILLTL